MNSLKRNKIWMVLAFFAVFGIMAGPLLAFNCCCAGGPKTQNASRACHQESLAVPSKPACHGNASSPNSQNGNSVKANSHCSSHISSETDTQNKTVATQNELQVAVGHDCQCKKPSSQPLTATEIKPAAKSFAFVALALPVSPFVAETSATPVCWAPTQAHAPPSQYAFAPLSGRAPPAC